MSSQACQMSGLLNRREKQGETTDNLHLHSSFAVNTAAKIISYFYIREKTKEPVKILLHASYYRRFFHFLFSETGVTSL